MILSRLLPLVLAALPLAATAHEFWIEPLAYKVEAGERLQAHFRNGEEFKGTTLSYFDRSAARFEMIAGGAVTVLTPRSGDSPALDVPSPVADGLVVVVHETTPSRLTYREWPKFLKFAAHKDFADAEARHLAAGWPQENFRESYSRHVKALIAVGSGQGTDAATGMKTEFVALTNPYGTDFDNDMKVRLLADGAPRADAQVEVFDRAPDGSVTITLHRTDAAGEAAIPVQSGHDYLFDAVVLQAAAQNGDNAAQPILWETYWAALTFAVP